MGAVSVEATLATLRQWAREELAPWRHCRRGPLERQLREIAATNPAMRLYHFAGSDVSLLPALPGSSDREAKADRAALYLRFFTSVARRLPPELNATLCLCPQDRAPADADAPIFRFQKRSTDRTPLVPDVDFIDSDFYRDAAYDDALPYDRKEIGVVFSGSTTGAQIDAAMAAACDTPRLRAAVFFRDKPGVDFRLPTIVQCRSEAARAILSGYDFCQQPRLTWHQQFERRFILSMDGNGATCSRVAIALKSHCVLMKSASDHVLYYFRALEPGRHYLPVRAEADVLTCLDAERAHPGAFAGVARAGTDLARQFLNVDRITDYMALLVTEYARIIEGDVSPV